MSLEQDVALLGAELDFPTRAAVVALVVNVTQPARHFRGILGDQAANKAPHTQAQGVVLGPLLMAGLHLLLLMVDVAQHAQLIVQAGEHAVQGLGLGVDGRQPVLDLQGVPALGAPFTGGRGVGAHFGVLLRRLGPLLVVVHGIGVGLDTGRCGVRDHLIAEDFGVLRVLRALIFNGQCPQVTLGQ